MNAQEILDGNILIAEFDGWYRDNKYVLFDKKDQWYHKNYKNIVPFVSKKSIRFRYHDDWKEIVPVLKKIKLELEPQIMSMCIGHVVGLVEFLEVKSKLNSAIHKLDLLLIFSSTVEWIKWYNTQPHQP